MNDSKFLKAFLKIRVQGWAIKFDPFRRFPSSLVWTPLLGIAAAQYSKGDPQH